MNVLASWSDTSNGTAIKYEIVQRDDNENDLYEISDSVKHISTKSDGMRVNVKFNDFTVRKLKPNIFENYQLIEASKASARSENLSFLDDGAMSGLSKNSFLTIKEEKHVESRGNELPVMCTTLQTLPLPEDKHDESDIDVVDEENRICEWLACNQCFIGLEALVQHVNSVHVQPSHVGGGFVCLWQNCPRKEREFNARYKMLIHMRIHTREKPHECKECGKRFSRHENLKIHVRTHTGEKPFQCSYCDKKFNNSSDRFKHQRTHINNRPYRCKINGCEKGYTDPSSLRKHVRSVHGFNDPSAYKEYVEAQDQVVENFEITSIAGQQITG